MQADGTFAGYFLQVSKGRGQGGVQALMDASRRKPNLKNRVNEATEDAVSAFAIKFPAYGQVRVRNELRKKGIFVSPSGARSIWLGHGLESMKLRFAKLEKMSAEEGLVLTEAQVQAPERKLLDDEASEDVETAHPDYLASQTLFMWAHSKGWGVSANKPLSTHTQR